MRESREDLRGQAHTAIDCKSMADKKCFLLLLLFCEARSKIDFKDGVPPKKAIFENEFLRLFVVAFESCFFMIFGSP